MPARRSSWSSIPSTTTSSTIPKPGPTCCARPTPFFARRSKSHEKGRPPGGGAALSSSHRRRLAGVEFDDQIRLHSDRIGHLVQRGNAGEGRLGGAVGDDVIWDVAL